MYFATRRNVYQLGCHCHPLVVQWHFLLPIPSSKVSVLCVFPSSLSWSFLRSFVIEHAIVSSVAKKVCLLFVCKQTNSLPHHVGLGLYCASQTHKPTHKSWIPEKTFVEHHHEMINRCRTLSLFLQSIAPPPCDHKQWSLSSQQKG